MTIPRLPDWIIDPTGKVEDPAKGGVVLRLVRAGAVPLAPRIEVVLEPLRAHPTSLEGFLTANLRELAHYEKQGAITIMQVTQQPMQVGPRRGFRVRHEYSMRGDGAVPIAITQLTTLLVLNGRGVAVTAAGQTELFHPLAASIESILTGISVPMADSNHGGYPLPAGAEGATPPPGSLPRSLVSPIDLGRIGGNETRAPAAAPPPRSTPSASPSPNKAN